MLAFKGAFVVGVLSALCGATAVPDSLVQERSLDLPGIWKNLTTFVTQINAFITLDSLKTNLISVNIEVHNPLFVELTVERVISNAGLNGTVYSQFDHSFTGFSIPPFSTKNSGTFGNVRLTQGATASLGIIKYRMLDITNGTIYIRAATINGALGIPITLPNLSQPGVPVNYTLNLSP